MIWWKKAKGRWYDGDDQQSNTSNYTRVLRILIGKTKGCFLDCKPEFEKEPQRVKNLERLILLKLRLNLKVAKGWSRQQ